MNRDDANFEDALRQCTPSRLDDRLAGRLLVALQDASNPVEEVDAAFESSIAAHRPAELPDHLIGRLATLAAPKIVAMPAPKRVIPFRRHAAAAAIALVGAAAALLVPFGGENPQVADTAPSAAPASTAAAPASTMDASAFVPASHQRGLSDARDEGVIWKDNAPHRVLRIVYMDTITLRNDAGEIVEVEQPRVEYILVPKKVD